MVRKAHLPTLLGEPIKEHQERCRHFLDLLLLAGALLDLAVLARDPSRDTARLLLDASGPFLVLLKASGHSNKILAATSDAGVGILGNLRKTLPRVMVLPRLLHSPLRGP